VTAPRTTARLVLNQSVLNDVQKALAFGLLNLGEKIAQEASANAAVSEDERYGHVRDQWGAAVYVDGKKISDISADGSAVNKPRAFRAGKGLAGLVGFGFPGRFLEVGTSDTRAQPFLSPAAQRAVGSAVETIRAGAAPHWPKPG
jgi:hypothetical protein